MHISALRKYQVKLQPEEEATLEQLIRIGTPIARTITRARVLLLANEGQKDKTIYKALRLAYSTPHDVRKRYHEGGLQEALFDAPRPGKERKLSGVEEAEVIAIACTTPPDGYCRWTLDLLTEKVKEKLAVSIGRSAIWKVCLRNKLKPWREKNVGYL
jgi:putative transposase